jgi:hypothetical protein
MASECWLGGQPDDYRRDSGRLLKNGGFHRKYPCITEDGTMLRKSIPCVAAGLLFMAGLFLFMAAYIFPEWQPGWPGLILWTAISFLIIGGTWLWDEVHEVRRGTP